MGLFLDGPSFDMMMVVVKDSWLPTVCVRKTKREAVLPNRRHPGLYNSDTLSLLTTPALPIGYVVLTPLRCIMPVDTKIERCFQFQSSLQGFIRPFDRTKMVLVEQ